MSLYKKTIGYCDYCMGYKGDSEIYTEGLSAVPDDTDKRKGPVEYIVTDEFEGWVCPECKEILIDDDVSRTKAERIAERNDFMHGLGID